MLGFLPINISIKIEGSEDNTPKSIVHCKSTNKLEAASSRGQ